MSNQMYNVAGGGIMYPSNQQYNANLIPNQHFSTNSNNKEQCCIVIHRHLLHLPKRKEQ